MARIRFKNVWKKFGDVVAIKNLSFETMDGEFFVLLGPSGAGKTTTLKLIAGLEEPTAGEIYLNGKPINDVPANKRNMAMTFEAYALYPHLTVYENLASPLRVPSRQLSREDIDGRVKRVAQMLNIHHLLSRLPGELSGGQKQRVSLGRSIIRDAAAFLLDEPLSHVDAKIRYELRAELHKLEALASVTTVYVTHDYAEALSLGDRIAVIDKGELKQLGTPREIYYSPHNIFTATHVGWPEINLLDCNLIKENGKGYLEVEGADFRLPLPPKLESILEDRGIDRFVLGVRPQFIEFSEAPMGEDWIAGEVDVFLPLGAQGVLTALVGGMRLRLLVSPELKLSYKQKIWLYPRSERFYYFHKETGENILVSLRETQGAVKI